jgi:hypothetical protein
MEQHAIPQNISSYQFRLVGDMTLKQFFQLAGGVLVALIFYSAPLPGLIKWPFVITSIILGVALAFMPLEERPLERWIFAFFKAVYTPTLFYWKKTAAPAKFFQEESTTPVVSASPQQEEALKAYLATPRQSSAPFVALEGAEQGFLSMLSGVFAGLTGQATGAPTPTANQQQPTVGAKKQMEIPPSAPIKISQPGMPRLVVEEKNQGAPSSQITTQGVAPIIAGEEIISTKQAIFSPEAAPPSPPTTPNVVVGQVVDTDRKIIEGAIMEIKDEVGRPIRALRSNKVGHFIIVTPLDNGRYDIITEKEGYQFAPVSFEAVGEIIPPILVEGRKIAVTQEVPVQPIQQSSSPAVQQF